MASAPLNNSLQDTLALFDSVGTPQTTNEIAQHLDIGRRSTYNRLNQLVDEGWLETKKVGGNGRVWWRPPDGSVPDTPEWDGATASLVDVLDSADVGVFVLDENCDIVWLNEAAEEYFDLDPTDVLGRDKRSIVEERIANRIENPTEFTDRVLSMYEDNASAERFECRVTPSDNRAERWLEYHSKPIETGAFAGGRVELYDDVTARKLTEQDSRSDRRELHRLVETVEEYAIFTLDAEGRVQSWNPGAREIKGYEPDEILGEHFSTFYPAEDCTDGLPEENLTAAAEEGSLEDEGWRVKKDGSRFWANVTITPIYDDEGVLDGYAKVTRDMSDRREYEQTLTKQAQRLERQRDELVTELDEIFERVDDAFYALSEDFQIEYVNDSAAAHFGRSPGELLGQNIWDVLDIPADDTIVEKHENAMATQDPVSFERYTEPLGIWASFDVHPSETGLSVYFRDVTDRKDRIRQLELYEQTVETIWDGVATLDDDDRFVMVNEAFCELTGYSKNELLGEPVTLIQDEQVRQEAQKLAGEIRESDRDFATLEFELQRADGQSVPVEGRFGPYEFECGKVGRTGVVRDISARIERERKLEESEQRYRTLVENFPDGSVGLFDENLCYTTAGGELMEKFDVDPDDRIGRSISQIHSEEMVEEIEPYFRQALAGESNSFELDYRDSCLLLKTLPLRDEGGDVFAGMVVVQDVTERRKREQELKESEHRYRTLIENFPNGAVALVDQDLRYLTVGGNPVEKAETTTEDLEGKQLNKYLPQELVDIVLPHYRAALGGEAHEVVRDIGERSYQFHFIPVRDDDGDVFAALGMSQDITRDRERQEELLRQRQKLAALNNLNDTVREITDAIITQSTREEIESIVCERLARTDSYEFAWIGDVDVTSQTVQMRTEAGVEGYLDGSTISVDPDDERSLGPTGRAIRSGEMQTASDVANDSRFDPWRDHIQEYEFQSSAAIPLVHEGSVYGALNVYADRTNAFVDEERRVISQLGEIVGHAIAAAERKRALMSDEVIELQFQVQNLFEALGIDASHAGTISIDHAVPIESDEFLLYGTATPDAVEGMNGIVEALPHWNEVSYRDDEGTRSFELRLTDPPILSEVTALGGSVESVVIEDGDGQITIHVTPNTDTRQVVDTVKDAYPGAEMVKRQQTERENMHNCDIHSEIMEGLTDRQSTCLETAVYSGFFEWPREGSAGDLAATIGIAPPTFHQHLRAAQKNVFETLFPSTVNDTQ